MTQLNLDNAGATSASHRLRLSYLDRRDARRLAAALYHSPVTLGARSDLALRERA
jgi:hypothetical protein